MKKMNNKGFAITTLLYGLMSVGFLVMTLLMGIMSQNRQNTSTLVKKIEEELNRYGETETTFAYIGTPQEYIVPYGQAGWYKIELWGAKTSSGLGDYTSGIVYLAENTKLYFYLGNTCANATACGTAFNKGNTEVRTNTATETSAIMRASGYGKTSYIAGYAGSNSLSEAGSATNQTNHFSGKYFVHASFCLSSARSDLLSRIRRALFCPNWSISGFLLLSGILASTNSIIKSMSLMSSCICRLAFVI